MKLTRFKFKFAAGEIEVVAINQEEATILAQAEAINKGWDYRKISYITYGRNDCRNIAREACYDE